MSSLAVALSTSADAPGAVGRMLAASPHRGTSYDTASLGRCAMGVSRSQDEGTRRARPAQVGVHDDLLVAVEGRIDNLADLAAGTGRERGASATEVVAAGFSQRGTRFANEIRGRCAVAVSDGVRVTAWRDHLGFAPLFYRRTKDGILVATEPKQVAAGARLPVVANLSVVDAVVWGTVQNDTPSAVQGVDRLAKSTVLAFEAGDVRLDDYWSPGRLLETAPRAQPAELHEEFDRLMEQACSRVLTGLDVISLSGGVDSPAVAAYAGPAYRALTGRPMPALTTVYPDHPEVDESSWVELVAADLGLDLHTYPHRRREHGTAGGETAAPGDVLRHWTRLFDGPVPSLWIDDLVTNYEQIASRGHRSVLTGEMAEFVADLREGLVPHLVSRGRWGPAAQRLRAQRAQGVPMAKLSRQVLAGIVPSKAVVGLAPRREGTRVRRLPGWVSTTRARRFGHDRGPGQVWGLRQLGMIHGPGLTVEADDVVSCALGVVSRRPFADVDLWEFFLRLPAESKFPDAQRKSLLRTLLRGRVPDAILDRKDKTSFSRAMLDDIDYPSLEALLARPEHRVEGVDYERLRQRVSERDLDLGEYVWARKLAWAHAFLESST